MTNRELLQDMGYEDFIVFDNPDFDSAIIGITVDNRVVYDYDKMVMDMSERDNIDPIDAEDFICYNTIRALPYIGSDAPIIMYRLDQEET